MPPMIDLSRTAMMSIPPSPETFVSSVRNSMASSNRQISLSKSCPDISTISFGDPELSPRTRVPNKAKTSRTSSSEILVLLTALATRATVASMYRGLRSQSHTVRELIEEIARHSNQPIPIDSISATFGEQRASRGHTFFGNPGDY